MLEIYRKDKRGRVEVTLVKVLFGLVLYRDCLLRLWLSGWLVVPVVCWVLGWAMLQCVGRFLGFSVSAIGQVQWQPCDTQVCFFIQGVVFTI